MMMMTTIYITTTTRNTTTSNNIFRLEYNSYTFISNTPNNKQQDKCVSIVAEKSKQT
jgi:hypothetical protein